MPLNKYLKLHKLNNIKLNVSCIIFLHYKLFTKYEFTLFYSLIYLVIVPNTVLDIVFLSLSMSSNFIHHATTFVMGGINFYNFVKVMCIY